MTAFNLVNLYLLVFVGGLVCLNQQCITWPPHKGAKSVIYFIQTFFICYNPGQRPPTFFVPKTGRPVSAITADR